MPNPSDQATHHAMEREAGLAGRNEATGAAKRGGREVLRLAGLAAGSRPATR